MILDPSQWAIIIASGIVTLIAGIVGRRLDKHAKNQEAGALRRERKQELHYKKLDAVIYALASASENINGQTFKRNYDEKMREYAAESQMMNE